MAIASVPFQIVRQALTAPDVTPVIAPMTCQSLTISNETGGTLSISSDDAGSNYVLLANGHERVFWLPTPSSGLFRQGEIACYLSAAMSGSVALVWA